MKSILCKLFICDIYAKMIHNLTSSTWDPVIVLDETRKVAKMLNDVLKNESNDKKNSEHKQEKKERDISLPSNMLAEWQNDIIKIVQTDRCRKAKMPEEHIESYLKDPGKYFRTHNLIKRGYII